MENGELRIENGELRMGQISEKLKVKSEGMENKKLIHLVNYSGCYSGVLGW